MPRDLVPADRSVRRLDRLILASAVALAVATAVAGCDASTAPPTPPIKPGTLAAPREVNIVAKDYSFIPPAIEVAPGETVLFHVINGGLVTHEAIIGDQAAQDAWEIAEAATADAPPGPTPLVSVPPAVGGLRIVVRSGERRDALYTVPGAGELFVGCHIPGHYAKGMSAPVRLVAAGG